MIAYGAGVFSFRTMILTDEAIQIGDDPFKISYMEYDTHRYEEFLQAKIDIVLAKLPTAVTTQITSIGIIRSPVNHFRQRCRFAVVPCPTSLKCSKVSKVDGLEESYCMKIEAADLSQITSGSMRTDRVGIVAGKSQSTATDHSATKDEVASTPLSICDTDDAELKYSLWENGGPNIIVDSFPIASTAIYNAMPILLKYVQTVKELQTDLRAINFLSTLSGELIATFVYELELSSIWEIKGKEMHSKLGLTS